MVDYLYGGSYANILVTGNTVTGQKQFGAGIAVGVNAWSFGSLPSSATRTSKHHK